MDWKRYAACRGRDPSLWVGSDDGRKVSGPSPVAQKYCAVCIVRGPCIDLAVSYAPGEAMGNWGGTRENMRKELRRRQNSNACSEFRHGCSCAYCNKVTEIMSAKSKVVSSNSRGARHGYCSTHSKGCRCRACCHAAAFRSRSGKQRRPDTSPVYVVVDPELCDPHNVDRCRACAHVEAMAA